MGCFRRAAIVRVGVVGVGSRELKKKEKKEAVCALGNFLIHSFLMGDICIHYLGCVEARRGVEEGGEGVKTSHERR